MKKKTTGAVSGAMIDKPQAAKPSPLPWRVRMSSEIFKDADPAEVDGIYSGSRRIVETDSGAYPPDLADAALIVRSVNSHAGLVEFLRKLADDMDSLDFPDVAEEARAALRAAGEAI